MWSIKDVLIRAGPRPNSATSGPAAAETACLRLGGELVKKSLRGNKHW